MNKITQDALESAANAIGGFLVSAAVTLWLLPLWGFDPTLEDSLGITSMFAYVSFLRSYLLRKLFRGLSGEY